MKTIIKSDSQILNSINLCGQRYEYEHVLNRRPVDKAEALSKGDMLHRMLAHYYRAKMQGRYAGRENIVVSEAIEIGNACASELHLETTESSVVVQSFRGYVLKYQYDGWEIQFVEQPFTTILYDSDDLQVLAFKRKVIINKVGFQETLPDEEKFRRYHFVYSEALINEWLKDAIHSFRTAIEWHRTGYFPRNRTSCDKYSGCVYKRVCAEEPEVRPYKLQAYFNLEEVWDVYKRDPE